MDQNQPGRRERKKAATRQAIADAALELFLERGYHAVSMRDIAEAADVSTTTLFKHFAGKEALVFDRDSDRETELAAAVRDRRDGEGVLEALHQHSTQAYRAVAEHPQGAEFAALVDATPELRDYSERMWTRHTRSLSAAIAKEAGLPADDMACAALARFVLDIPGLIRQSSDPYADIDAVFALLRNGWNPG